MQQLSLKSKVCWPAGSVHLGRQRPRLVKSMVQDPEIHGIGDCKDNGGARERHVDNERRSVSRSFALEEDVGSNQAHGIDACEQNTSGEGPGVLVRDIGDGPGREDDAHWVSL